MKIEKFYQYFGENGAFTSPIRIPGVPSYTYAILTADEGKVLTDGYRRVTNVVIAEANINEWSEVDE